MIPIKKAVKRKTDRPFLHYKVTYANGQTVGKAIVVELVPGDVIRLKLYGQRDSSAVSVTIHDLYYQLVRQRVAALRAKRTTERNQRRKAKRLAK
jgi:hypothetical protein